MACTYQINSINHLLLLQKRIYSMVYNGKYILYYMIPRVCLSLHLAVSMCTQKYIRRQHMMSYNWLTIVLTDTIMFSLLLFPILSIIMNYDEGRTYHCRGYITIFYPCTAIIEHIYICYWCSHLPQFPTNIIIWCHTTHIYTCR